MVASTFGGAFDRLPRATQQLLIEQLRTRKTAYCQGLTGWRSECVKAILVGDRPGNGAKLLPANHHHTPFYSTKNSSLWLNKQLVEASIPEESLFWVNAYDMHGVPSHPSHLEGWSNPAIIALGGNAAKWLDQWPGKRYTKVHHPQAWKRFHSGEAYPLIAHLRSICST